MNDNTDTNRPSFFVSQESEDASTNPKEGVFMDISSRIRWAIVPLMVAMTFERDVRAEDLPTAWSIALGTNRQLQSQQYQTRSNALSLAASKTARLPTVRSFNIDSLTSPSVSLLGNVMSAGASTNGSSGTSPGANQKNIPISNTSLNYSIYTGGKLKANVDAASANLNAQRFQEFQTALELKLTVADAYVGVLRSIRSLDVARSDVARLDAFARDIKNRMAVGVSTRNDELAAEVSLANARQTEIRARRTLATSWATYNRYLCRPLSEIADLDDLTADPGPKENNLIETGPLGDKPTPGAGEEEIATLTAQAFKIRPELARLSEQARSYEAQARATRAGIRPQVSIMTGYTYLGADALENKSFLTSLVMVDWTITDFGTTRRRALAQQNQELSTLKQRDNTADDIALEVRSRWLEVQETRLRIPFARVAVDQARENITVVTDRYRQGLSTYTEVLDAESRRVQSFTNLYDANYDAVLAVFRLRRAIGDL
jgi:outer membrane protein TolC